MSRIGLTAALCLALLVGVLIGGIAGYFANRNPTSEAVSKNLIEEIEKWRRSSIEFETALLRHKVIDIEYEPTKKYMTDRIAAGDDFIEGKISFEGFESIAKRLDDQARATGVIHAVGGQDIGYRVR